MYRGCANIDSAVRAGLLEVVSYDTEDPLRKGDLTVDEEVAGMVAAAAGPSAYFKAYPSKAMSLGAAHTAELDSVEDDSHDGFDAGHYRYVFPVAGVWEVSFKATALLEKEGDYLLMGVWQSREDVKPVEKQVAEALSVHQSSGGRYAVVEEAVWVVAASTKDFLYATVAYPPGGTLQAGVHRTFLAGRLLRGS
jgi:hypothetical protein